MPLRTYRLISEEVWTQLRSHWQKKTATGGAPVVTTTTTTAAAAEEEPRGPVSPELLLVNSGRPTVVTGQYDDLIGQLPKCCRRKSTTIISYL
jgi:hypothetical protein